MSHGQKIIVVKKVACACHSCANVKEQVRAGDRERDERRQLELEKIRRELLTLARRADALKTF